MTQGNSQQAILDTDADQLGKVYAQALIAATEAAGNTEEVVGQLAEFVDECLTPNPTLVAAFSSPQISAEEKGRVIDRLLGGQAALPLIQLLKVMAGRDRLAFVPAVRTAAERLRDEKLGQIVAEVKTAVPLDDSLRQSVTERIARATEKQVRLVEVVDPQLAGGMVIRIGDTVFDGSVATHFQRLTRQVRSGFKRELLARIDALSEN